MPTYLEHIALVIDQGVEPAMNLINQRPSTEHERHKHKPI